MSDAISSNLRKLNASLSSETRPDALARLDAETRRHFLRSATGGLGAMFLGTLMSPLAGIGEEGASSGLARIDIRHDPNSPLGVLPPQFAPRAKRVIYLHMAGA